MDSQKILKPRGVTRLVVISAMTPLFPTPQKGEDLISIYSHGTHDFYQQSLAQDVIVGQQLGGGTFKKEINVQLLKGKGGVERKRSATWEPVNTKLEVIFCQNVGIETDLSRSSRLFPRNQDTFIFSVEAGTL
jgi:hypothetical protein